MTDRSSPVAIDPAELWEEWLEETEEKYRTPQSALAFAVDRMASLQPASPTAREALREERRAERKERTGLDVEEALTLDDAPAADAVAGDAKALAEKINLHLQLGKADPGFHLSEDDLCMIVKSLHRSDAVAATPTAWRVWWVGMNRSQTELFEDRAEATAKARETGGCIIPLFTGVAQAEREPGK
jgi:hypothetical protein